MRRDEEDPGDVCYGDGGPGWLGVVFVAVSEALLFLGMACVCYLWSNRNGECVSKGTCVCMYMSEQLRESSCSRGRGSESLCRPICLHGLQ